MTIMTPTADLHTKYRPSTLDDVLGHGDVIQALRASIARKDCHAFIFAGEAGIGKTTIARCIATTIDAEQYEVDAASNSGVDNVRALIQNQAVYRPMGKSARVIIIDEAHGLSRQAWQALQKTIEEPPPYIYWALCTTALSKIPKTIQTRCQVYKLGPVPTEDVEDLLVWVIAEEGMFSGPEKLSLADGIVELVAHKAQGSPRKALTLLGALAACEDIKAAKRLAEDIEDPNEPIQFCRLLFKGKAGPCVQELQALEKAKVSAEAIRLTVLGYAKTTAYSTAGEAGSKRFRLACAILESFDSAEPIEGYSFLITATAALFL